MLPEIQSNHDISWVSEPKLNMCLLYGASSMAETLIHKNSDIQNVTFLCNIIITIQRHKTAEGHYLFKYNVHISVYYVHSNVQILKNIFLFTKNDAAWTQYF